MKRPEDPVWWKCSSPNTLYLPACRSRHHRGRRDAPRSGTGGILAPPGKVSHRDAPNSLPDAWHQPRQSRPGPPSVPTAGRAAPSLTQELPSGLPGVAEKEAAPCWSLGVGAAIIYSGTEQPPEKPRGRQAQPGLLAAPARAARGRRAEPSAGAGRAAAERVRAAAAALYNSWPRGEGGLPQSPSGSRWRGDYDIPPGTTARRPWLQRGLGWGGVCAPAIGERGAGNRPQESYRGKFSPGAGGEWGSAWVIRGWACGTGRQSLRGNPTPRGGGRRFPKEPRKTRRVGLGLRIFGMGLFFVAFFPVSFFFYYYLFVLNSFSFSVSSLSATLPNPQAADAESSCCMSSAPLPEPQV